MKKGLDSAKSRSVAAKDTALRILAEQRLQSQYAEHSVNSVGPPTLLHELQVHQIELEMQNEELRRTRAIAEEASAHYAELYDYAPVGYITLDREFVIGQVNFTAAALLRMQCTALIGVHFETFVRRDDRRAFSRFLNEVFDNRSQDACDLVLDICSNKICIVRIEAATDSLGSICRMTLTDISARKRAEDALAITSSVYETIHEAVVIADTDNRIVAVNPAFSHVTGYAEQEAIGQKTNLLKSGFHDEQFYQRMWQELETDDYWQGQIWNRRKNGEVYPEWLVIYVLRDANGKVLHRIGLFSDITDQMQARETIERQANFDDLTQLPNRILFHDRLEQGIKKCIGENTSLVLLFVDLDHFKEVNDTLGHQLGDELLVEATRRILNCVHETDTVARMGGDEFTVIIPDSNDLSTIGEIVQSIIGALAKPFELETENIFISASIGIAVYPGDGSRINDLTKHAEQAMYVAKKRGRNRYSYFTPVMQKKAEKRMRLINDLHVALEKKQFRVHYQPIVDLSTNTIHKAEALVRWEHPVRGLVNPAEFIPLAEDTGTIVEIGDWIFDEALIELKRLRETYHPDFQISVNKSPAQFRSNDGADHRLWLSKLESHGLPGNSVVIEITERLLLDAAEHVTDRLIAFRDIGIQTAIDDFGTGYSSLAYLKKFDIDYLKIDRSFVMRLEEDDADMALCEAIIVMAHKLGMKVIAEGVETEGQRRFLADSECDYAQGLLFSKAIPSQELEQLLVM